MRGFLVVGPNGSSFLPYDISEHVARHMSSDFACLRTASLVCRSWGFASRTWLFRNLTLEPSKYNILLTLIQRHKSCSFLKYCRVLNIHSIDVRTISPPFVALFACVTRLRIQNASVPSLKDLFDFGSSFPQISSVSFKDVSWSRTAPIPLPSLPTVVRLEVCGAMEYRRLFEAIGRFEVFPNLRHLEVGPLEEVHMPAIAYYVACPRQLRNIQSLTLSLACEEVQDRHISFMAPPLLQQMSSKPTGQASGTRSPVHEKYHQAYGLEPCSVQHPHLRHFRLRGFVDVTKPVQRTALSWTPRILTALSMPNIQCIEMDLILDRAGQLDQYGIHWTFIDFAFSTTDFTNLKKVVFIVLGPADTMSVADILCRRMPLSTERGVLYLRSGEEDLDQSVKTLRAG